MTFCQTIAKQLVSIAYRFKLGPKPACVRCRWFFDKTLSQAICCNQKIAQLYAVEARLEKNSCGPRGKYWEKK